jgi:hypothetical protein
MKQIRKSKRIQAIYEKTSTQGTKKKKLAVGCRALDVESLNIFSSSPTRRFFQQHPDRQCHRSFI